MTITKEDPRFWDVRTLERRIRKGQITRKDIEKYTKTLPDSTDKVAPPGEGEGEESTGES
jgi:hypothetical protein